MTSANGSIVVFCRRAVDWDEPNYADRRSHFNQKHPLRKLLQEWREKNPGTGFHEYRLFLHQLARRTWEATGAHVLLNHVAMDQDGKISSETLQVLRRADWIVPTDDDDWLAPDLVSALRTAAGEVVGAIWDSLPLHIKHKCCRVELHRPYLSLDVAAPARIVLSCAYAINRRGAACLSDIGLTNALLHHGKASPFLLSSPLPIRELGIVGSVHLRHQATAGSATKPVDRTLGDFVIPDEIADLTPWALEPLGEVKALHAARVGPAREATARFVGVSRTG